MVFQTIDKRHRLHRPGGPNGGEWVGGEINAGDLLIFHSLTVHEAAPNRSNQLRISIDCRFQSFDNPVNPGTLSSLEPAIALGGHLLQVGFE